MGYCSREKFRNDLNACKVEIECKFLFSSFLFALVFILKIFQIKNIF